VSKHAWRHLAACRDADTELFFQPEHGDYRQALAFCRECPVRIACLADALATESGNGSRHGMRGGLAPKARAKLVRQR
jgi:WhiB family redox-sensing transcriptional regulator